MNILSYIYSYMHTHVYTYTHMNMILSYKSVGVEVPGAFYADETA